VKTEETPWWAQADGADAEAQTRERVDMVRRAGIPQNLFGRILEALARRREAARKNTPPLNPV
jgi:hypothetical protein